MENRQQRIEGLEEEMVLAASAPLVGPARKPLNEKLLLALIIAFAVVIVAVTIYGVWEFEREIFPGCSLHTPHGCAYWVWDYSKHLRTHPH